MKQKVFQTKNGVELYVDFESIEYQTTDIEAIKTALNKDINSEDRIASASAKEVLRILNTIDRIQDILVSQAN